jgi:hypothetical protein
VGYFLPSMMAILAGAEENQKLKIKEQKYRAKIK